MAVVLGIDIGTSSVKVALVKTETGQTLATAQSPESGEIPLTSTSPGWAEQNPEDWWTHTCLSLKTLGTEYDLSQVQAIGIAYQMHGLVLVDEQGSPVRPAIIWCDSRAVKQGDQLADKVGLNYCHSNLLNHPGNFTASKLAWVAHNEPATLSRATTAFLPGDYIAMRLTGHTATSETGLSEMTLWDFKENCPALPLLQATTAPESILPTPLTTFVSPDQAPKTIPNTLGIPPNTPVTYRAGDQPNNALSLGALEPGEAATTAGTSGVVYAVTDQNPFDPQGRVNSFLHVNHTPQSPRRGVLLCLNGCGSLYSWLRRTLLPQGSFADLNNLAAQAPAGADGLDLYPYGNGAERILGNQNPGAAFRNLDFNRHSAAHLARAAQEGIVFALAQGLQVMAELNTPVKTVRAGKANLFQSDLFCQTFTDTTGCDLTLHETNGAIGAAIGAGIGAGLVEPNSALPPQILKTFQPGEKSELLRSRFKSWLQNSR